MKTLLTKTIFIIFCIFFFNNQLISQTQPFLSFGENLNLPQDNLGVMPECIVEVNDVIDETPVHKLFVYGMQGLLIYDLNSTNWWLFPEKIEFSEQPFGYYDRSLLFDLENYPARQPMIYVPEEQGFGQLFAVGPDLRLWCINAANDQAEHVLTSSYLSGFSLISSKLVYDPINTRILWLVNAKSMNSENYICSLLPVSLTNYSIGNPLEIPGTISDFAINDDATNNVMYLGLNAGAFGRYWILVERNNLYPIHNIQSYKVEFDPGLIKYVHTNDNHTNEIHQVYCLPDCKNTQQAAIYVFNGDSPSHSYLTIASPVHGYMCSAFNDDKNHLFLGAYTDITEPVFNDVFIFQCQNNLAPTPLCTLNTNGFSSEKQNLPFSIEPVNGNENLIMKRHEIVKLTYNEGTQCPYSFQPPLLQAYGNYFGNADPTADSRVFVTSMAGGGFLEYLTNTTPWTLINHQTGQAVHSCFTSGNTGKSYYFSKNHTANSHIFIDGDVSLWSFTDYPHQNPIGDCIYNPFQHQILISDYLGSPNATLNAYTETQGGLTPVDNIDIDENVTHNGEMFITNDGKLLFFSGGNNDNPKINIRSALNYHLPLGEIDLTIDEFSGSDQVEVLFAGNPYQNYFVVSDVYDPDGGQTLQPTSPFSYFYVLDPGNLSESPSIQIQQDAPKFLEVTQSADLVRGKLFAFVSGLNNSITEIDIDHQTLEMTVYNIALINQSAAMKIVRYSGENGPKDELFIVTWQGGTSSKLYKYIPGSQVSPLFITDINSFISSMSYNYQTGLLYCYGTDNDSSIVFQFDVMNQFDNESDGLKLKRIANENFGSNFFFKPNEMIFDNENHQAFIPNGEHSSISRLGFAFDRIHVKDKVSWLSFPRLENQEFSAQTLLEGIRPFPTSIYMENIPLPPESPSIKKMNFEYPDWIWDEINNIQSTFGYKLSSNSQYITYLPMLGSILDPSTNITINTGRENWVGYFPTWPQDPFDALAGVLDKLTLIKHHDWACAKYECGAMGPGEPPYYCWICSITTPLKYADMLVLECSEDVTFQWGGEFTAEKRELPQPIYYTYAEKPDYTPIFIELDTNDLPLEIGAFVADSCIGATVVQEGDTSVMLRGYMPTDTSGAVTFEKYYGAEKRYSDRISDYFVQNDQTRVREKRTIDSREKRKYFQVSFKNENNDLLSSYPLILNFNPNPCKGSCTIEYFLPGESDVTFEVFDVYGRKINNLFIKNEQAGNYSILWSNLMPGECLPGIYMIRMSACGNTITKKVIITK